MGHGTTDLKTIRSASAGKLERGPFSFARKVLVFFSPIFLVLILVEAILWRTGESWPIGRVIEAQRGAPERLFMRAILDQGFYRYKFLQIQERKPKVLVLGSSRVMEFRAEMFGVRSNEFFNAGGIVQDLSDLEGFVQSLGSENTPEMVILGMDLWWFNGNRPLLNGFTGGVEREAAFDWQEHVRAVRKFNSSRMRKRIVQAWRAAGDNIGIEARSRLVGFRGDGSMQYNFPLPTQWKFIDREMPPVAERIRNGAEQFTPAAGISRERLELLRNALERLRERKVLVLGFLPPFSQEAAGLLDAGEAQSRLWREFREEMPKVFTEAGQPFIDASLNSDMGLSDIYLIDGMHAAETFHLHLLQRFLEDQRVRAILPGLAEAIATVLRSEKTNPWQPDYPALFP